VPDDFVPGEGSLLGFQMASCFFFVSSLSVGRGTFDNLPPL
jgi:hypothetical protein